VARRAGDPRWRYGGNEILQATAQLLAEFLMRAFKPLEFGEADYHFMLFNFGGRWS
jgi:hypothetical protein